MEKEQRALDQAEKEIPTRWYEGQRPLIAGYVVLYTAVTLLGVAKFGDPVAHLTAAITYITSAIADEKTTLEFFEAKDKARKTGFNSISESINEGNPFLRHVKTAEGFRAEKTKKIILNGLVFAISAILPAVGMSISGSKFLAAMNNYRRAKRINRATEIALNESKTN